MAMVLKVAVVEIGARIDRQIKTINPKVHMQLIGMSKTVFHCSAPKRYERIVGITQDVYS